MPEQIKRWIANSFFASPRETFVALTKLIDRGEFKGIPVHLITPYNTSYWWTVALENRIGTKGDAWLNALDYLERQPLVNQCRKSSLIFQADPEPFLTEPRKHLIWFVYRRFGVILEAVREVFVDATFGTNSLGAHFYCILGQENGWFVPLAYMLLEAKQKEKTNDSSPDVTECVTHFFAAAQRKGLDPHFVHVDKCFSEINAAKVNPLNPIRAFNMNSNFISTNLCGFLFFALCIHIILTPFITCALQLICRLQLLGPTHNPACVRGTYTKL
jgi:hypothetical protein